MAEGVKGREPCLSSVWVSTLEVQSEPCTLLRKGMTTGGETDAIPLPSTFTLHPSPLALCPGRLIHTAWISGSLGLWLQLAGFHQWEEILGWEESEVKISVSWLPHHHPSTEHHKSCQAVLSCGCLPLVLVTSLPCPFVPGTLTVSILVSLAWGGTFLDILPSFCNHPLY